MPSEAQRMETSMILHFHFPCLADLGPVRVTRPPVLPIPVPVPALRHPRALHLPVLHWPAPFGSRTSVHALIEKLVAIVAEFITPILAQERPELVFVVDTDVADILHAAAAVALRLRLDIFLQRAFSPWRISYSILITRVMRTRNSFTRRSTRLRAISPASFTAKRGSRRFRNTDWWPPKCSSTPHRPSRAEPARGPTHEWRQSDAPSCGQKEPRAPPVLPPEAGPTYRHESSPPARRNWSLAGLPVSALARPSATWGPSR